MKVKMTNKVEQIGVNFCIYGEAGIGKTTLCATAPNPIIISAEGGLMSLNNYELPFVEIANRNDCDAVYDWLIGSKEAKAYKTICIDSLSEIAEVLLSEKKKTMKDPRNAYGEMADEMAILIRGFRDIKDKHVYFSCKVKKDKDEATGVTSFSPSVPGQVLPQALPYFFDELFVMRMGKLPDGSLYRYLQTSGDLRYLAKDRSGTLPKIAEPNLGKIITTISKGVQNGVTTTSS